jgi:hypothetical protein
MKARIILVSVILGVIIAFWLSGVASAADTGSVTPIVHVIESYSGSLTIGGDVVGGVMDFGYMVPGGEAVTRTLNLNVTANAGWRITVTTTQNLAVGGYELTKYIPPDKFTFTSDGNAGPTYVTSDTPFRTSADDYPTEVTKNVVTDGSATDSCNVNVVYKLLIPAAQQVDTYSALHTYTLVVD